MQEPHRNAARNVLKTSQTHAWQDELDVLPALRQTDLIFPYIYKGDIHYSTTILMRPVSEQFYDDDVDDGDEDDESSDARPEDTSKEEFKVSKPPPPLAPRS